MFLTLRPALHKMRRRCRRRDARWPLRRSSCRFAASYLAAVSWFRVQLVVRPRSHPTRSLHPQRSCPRPPPRPWSWLHRLRLPRRWSLRQPRHRLRPRSRRQSVRPSPIAHQRVPPARESSGLARRESASPKRKRAARRRRAPSSVLRCRSELALPAALHASATGAGSLHQGVRELPQERSRRRRDVRQRTRLLWVMYRSDAKTFLTEEPERLPTTEHKKNVEKQLTAIGAAAKNKAVCSS